ncbi:unnamed protein product, partial [Laminaria digitata]
MTTLEHLTDQIKTGLWKDRRIACELLADLGDAAAVDPLVYALDDHDYAVREAAFIALGKLNHPLAAGPMIDHLQNESEESVRLAGLHALGRLRNPNAVPHLVSALQDELTSVRLAATQALGIIRDIRAVRDLINCLDDANLYIRAAACESLGLLKNASTTRFLIKMLGDGEPLVREKSLEALRRMGEYDLVSAYNQAFFGEKINPQALRSLARQGDVRVVSALVSRLGNPWSNDDQKDRLEETIEALFEPAAATVDQLLCSVHLARFIPQRQAIKGVGKINFVGCRVCNTTYNALPAPSVIAVLDEQMTTKKHYQQNILRVNWLKKQEVFDFNRVEVGVAEDKLVTQFCLMLSNDTDPGRPDRCYDMVCDVLPASKINNNTFQILKRTF